MTRPTPPTPPGKTFRVNGVVYYNHVKIITTYAYENFRSKDIRAHIRSWLQDPDVTSVNMTIYREEPTDAQG